MSISLERAQQIVGCIAHEMCKADMNIEGVTLEIDSYQQFLDTVDVLTTILAGEVWGKITEKEFNDVLEIEAGITKEEIEYLSNQHVLNRPKFKGESNEFITV